MGRAYLIGPHGQGLDRVIYVNQVEPLYNYRHMVGRHYVTVYGRAICGLSVVGFPCMDQVNISDLLRISLQGKEKPQLRG